MLLLVLILVLAAFGLLVVALLTGNVLCAWLSVAVSVAAAVVLVVDWLQRRSAVKAGAAAVSAPPASTPFEAIPLAEPDPVTEVLPVIPPLAEPAEARNAEDETRFDHPADGQQTVVMPAVQPSGSNARPPGAEEATTSSGGSSSPRVTEKAGESSASDGDRTVSESLRGDVEETVAVDIRKAGVDKSAPDSAGVDRPGLDNRGLDKPGLDGRKPEASGTDVPRTDVPRDGAPRDGAQGSSGSGTAPSAPGFGAAGSGTSTVAGDTDRAAAPASDGGWSGIGSAAAGGAAALAAASAGSAFAGRSSSRPDDSAADAVDDGHGAAESTSKIDTTSTSRPDVADDERAVAAAVSTVKGAQSADNSAPGGETADSSTSGGPSSSVDANRGGPGQADAEATVSTSATTAGSFGSSGSTATESAAAGASVDEPTRATFGGPASSGHELFDPVERPVADEPPPPPPSGAVEETAVMNAAGSNSQPYDESDPPEEPLDPAAARIVAGLDDEVLVIDEQPRYHVASCRSVASQATIPLPAREAIELGFTPCGWCTPDAVLADRHRASARP